MQIQRELERDGGRTAGAFVPCSVSMSERGCAPSASIYEGERSAGVWRIETDRGCNEQNRVREHSISKAVHRDCAPAVCAHTHRSPTRTGPCTFNAVGLLSLDVETRGSPPLAPPPRVCGEKFTLPYLTLRRGPAQSSP